MRVLLLLLALTLTALADNYAAIDRHAVDTPKEMEKDVPTLARYLCQNAKTDEQKARALFRWVADRIKYSYESWGSYDPSVILDTRRGVCHDYAFLYCSLAEAAGLTCAYIDGHSRDVDRGPFQGLHAWNAVRIGSQWRDLDACWGAGWYDVESAEFTKDFKEEWFFTPPEEFNKRHMREKPYESYLKHWQAWKQNRLAERRTLERIAELERKGDYRAALEETDKLHDRLVLAQVLALRASLKLKLGDLKGAWTEVQMAVREDPKAPSPYLTRGLLLEKAGDLKEALHDVERALKRNPNLPGAQATRKRLRAALFLAN